MTKRMKKIGSSFILIIFLFLGYIAQSQIVFRAKGPSVVGINEGFTISYTINASNPKHFEAPSVSGARIVAGPNTSQSSSTTIINGKVSSSSSVTFSYTLVAQKTGNISISPAKVSINGVVYTSNTLKIQATNNPSMSQRGYNQQRQQNYGQQYRSYQPQNQNNKQPSSTQVQIDNQAIFVRAIANKYDVFKGEEVIITYKLYTLLPVSEYEIEKIPSSNGFWIEELDKQSNPQLSVETYNGRRYQVAELRKVIVYPQKSGHLTIKPMALTVTAHIASRQKQNFSTGDPFFDQFLNDPFFSSFRTSYKSVRKKIYTNSITFNVKELPNKKDNFCSGVGKFTISGDISTKQVKAYEPFYLTYSISGKGNLTLINNLPLDIPDEFQLSDPEIIDNLQRDALGLSGTRTFRYLVIPRVEGKFFIPNLNISYFNIEKRDYDSLTLKGYNIQVTKGDIDPNFANQLDARLKYRNMNIKSDINISPWDKQYHIFDNNFLYCLPFIFILLLIISIFFFARYKRLSADIINVKMKKSTKVAVKRLKKAKKYLDKNEMELFEDETAIALWTYLEDRFKMDRTKLSIQGCKDELITKGIDNKTVENLGTILERCQYLRFSQDKEATADITLYNDTINVISSIEEQMKNLKKIKKQDIKKPEHEIHIPTTIILLVILFTSLFGFKTSNAQSAQQYCKTADSCFKQSDYANAILYYEKALKLSPSNKDIKLNINITRSRLVRDTYIMPDFVLVKWAKHISGLLSLPVWCILFLSLFIITCVLFFLYIFSQNKKVLLFYLTIFALILSLSSMGFGIIRQNIMNDNSHAIIMKSNIHLRQTKNEGAKDVIIMYKGQKIKIIENDVKWIKASTEDNKTGYMENKYFKRI